MGNDSLLTWLNNVFAKEGHSPSSYEGLRPEEKILAEKITELCKKAGNYENRSKVYLQALNRTEGFYEVSIRALSALIKVGRLGEEVKDVYTLCKNTLEVFSHELEFENCSLMLKDTDGEYLILMAGRGRGDRYLTRAWEKGRRIKIGEGIAGQVAKTGEHIFISDVTKDSRFKNFKMKVNITSLLSVPLKSEDEIIGVINFSHPFLEAFDENRINLMLLLSNFVGQMITLTKLHNKIANWNETLKKEVQGKTQELIKKNRELQRIAVSDPLTGLYNRRFFSTRLEEEFSRAIRYHEHFSLLILDIDNLKPINDTYGHLGGDRVIMELARVLKKLGRKGDVMARIGGDEFGYVLIEAHKRDAYQFASRIKKHLAMVKVSGLKIKPTVSIGIAHSTIKGLKRYQDIYKAADDALYVEKKNKKTTSLLGSSTPKKQ
ncbi:MAG: sensor domain-containing diguanylate cyclase [Nitrospirae bacterium]|nr:sensor domain-containing diguanylate cyclase [Nitrospirota bacterium]